MSCTNPLKAFTIGINEETGNAKLKICSRDVTYLLRDGHTWFKCYDPVEGSPSDDENHIYSYDFIPCGKCRSCRLSRAKDWTTRCMLEAQYHDDNYFVTLTYDTDSLSYYTDRLSGKFTGKSTLVKADFQKFLKRLRKNYSYDNSIRYLLAGEYGSLSLRPHAHLCLFGLHLDDLQLYKNTSLGFSLYTSEFLNRCWSRRLLIDDDTGEYLEEPDFYTSNGSPRKYLGFVIVASLTYESASYVARYCVKKQGDDNKDIYEDYMIEPEFITMSRRPSLGLQYYLDHRDEIYKFDKIILPEGKVVMPPKYFDKLFERDCPDEMAVIKERRKHLSQITLDDKLSQTDYDLDQYFEIKDFYLKERTKSLQRKEI